VLLALTLIFTLIHFSYLCVFFFDYRMKWRLFVSTKFTIRLCHKDKVVEEETELSSLFILDNSNCCIKYCCDDY